MKKKILRLKSFISKHIYYKKCSNSKNKNLKIKKFDPIKKVYSFYSGNKLI